MANFRPVSLCDAISKVPDFYTGCIASRQAVATSAGLGPWTISPVSRFEFVGGISLAILFLVQKVAQSIFYCVATFVTCGLNRDIRASFIDNTLEGVIYALAIPLGCLGAIIPQTINQEVLHLSFQ